MTIEEAREQLWKMRGRECSNRDCNKGCVVYQARDSFCANALALNVALNVLRQISHLKGRPCEVCEFHSDNGCSKWKCIFEEGTK